MKHLLLALLLPLAGYGQGDQTIIKVPLDKYGSTESAILHLPDDYAKTSTRYPLMVFLHGVGEGGNNPASIYNSATAGGPAYFIAQKKFPNSFKNPADGKSYKFIVVSPQNNTRWSTTALQLDYILTSLYKTYRIDTSRVYLTGLSAGGEGVVEYTSKLLFDGTSPNTTHKIAAIIPMSAVMNAYLRLPMATNIINDNVYTWGFGSPTDTHGGNTLELIEYIDRLKPGCGLQTSYKGGHCCWSQFYDPKFKQNGLNIYEWALQYSKAPAIPAASLPVAAAAVIPGKIEAENYSGMSGGIQTQNTYDVGGGRNVGWIDQGNWMDYPVKVAAAGVYTVSFRIATTYSTARFQLRASDGTVLATVSPGPTGGFQIWKTVSAVITLPAGNQTLRLCSVAGPRWNINWMQFTSGANGQPVPGIIQGESYSDFSGIGVQGTSDVGGGRNVGWINGGDWMDYAVKVAAAGKYQVDFRVATPYKGARFQLKAADGTVLATVSPVVTGGFQSWKTVSAIITLPAGYQTLRLYSAASPEWNINWMKFSRNSDGKNKADESVGVSGQLSFDTSAVTSPVSAAFILYPNPAGNDCRLQLTNQHKGDMLVHVIDVSGTVRHLYKFNKDQSSILVNLPLADVPAGTYIIRVQIGEWSETKKMIKIIK